MHNICGKRKTETFMSTTTLREYHMKHFTTCATRYVVYLPLWETVCGMHYTDLLHKGKQTPQALSSNI